MTETVEVLVEIPRGSRNKFEIDPEDGRIRFDRRLPAAVSFPADYGSVPGTAGSDGEPLDALVLLVEPAYPGVWVTGRVVGVFWIATGHGREAKLVCVPEGEPAYTGVAELDELPGHLLSEIAHFFDVYRMLDPDSSTSCDGYEGAAPAAGVLREARQRATGRGPDSGGSDRR